MKQAIATVLNNIAGVGYWNIDLEDSDKILRLETPRYKAQRIEFFLKMAGFEYSKLSYQL
jgi:hypothetical protein